MFSHLSDESPSFRSGDFGEGAGETLRSVVAAGEDEVVVEGVAL